MRLRNRPRRADFGIKEMDTFEKKLKPPLSSLENSQNWRQKHSQVYMTRLKNQATVRKESKIVRASYVKISFKTLKLIDGVIKDAPSLQHFSVLFNISLPCCLLCDTVSRRGRTSRSSTDASSLESPENV